MLILQRFSKISIIILLLLTSSIAFGYEIRIAVASNFTNTMKKIVIEFEKQSEHTVVLIPGSTGKHYGQIINGAPFDLFFAADAKIPKLLVEKKLAKSSFTYAQGKLVLLSNTKKYLDNEAKIISNINIKHVAIANPKFSPYGQATEEFLRNTNLLDKIQKKIILGQNVSQTYQFIASGNAEIGFVAYSQIIDNDDINGYYWLIAEDLYTPIKQQVALLKENDATREFLNYIRQNSSLKIIESFGYNVNISKKNNYVK